MCSHKQHITHEQYVQQIRKLAVERLQSIDPDQAAKLAKVKLVYGLGQTGLRGVTWFDKWQKGQETLDLAEVCAFGEHDDIQLTGTTLHELAHVIAGRGAGHGKEWKDACKLIGLRVCKAAGQHYMPACFDQPIRMAVAQLEKPMDGKPLNHTVHGTMQVTLKPCSAGIGTRGGKSRGTGSGSRMRKYACPCGVIVRSARDDLDATCNRCGQYFERA